VHALPGAVYFVIKKASSGGGETYENHGYGTARSAVVNSIFDSGALGAADGGAAGARL
jgi:hypothetical protein